jgi:O-acetyl-ADP-ribose deacetylase (regulator of RNase III)
LAGRYKVIRDICAANTEVVVNAANSLGWMGGFLSRFLKFGGVAQALNRRTHGRIEKLAMKQAKLGKPGIGDVFITPGMLEFKPTVFHAVTMEKPGKSSSLGCVERCLVKVVDLCLEHRFNSVTLPLLGCGVGGLDELSVLELIYKNFEVTDLEVTIAHPSLQLFD